MKKNWWFIVFAHFAIPVALAQNTGSLTGYVKDGKTGKPLIGATVRLEGVQLGSISDTEGFYEIKNIPA
jgi:iron complex outermembrane recepter protein